MEIEKDTNWESLTPAALFPGLAVCLRVGLRAEGASNGKTGNYDICAFCFFSFFLAVEEIRGYLLVSLLSLLQVPLWRGAGTLAPSGCSLFPSTPLHPPQRGPGGS